MYVIGTAGHVDHGKSALMVVRPRTKVRGINRKLQTSAHKLSKRAADFSPRGWNPK